jgi:acetyl esterase/lipase
MKKALYVLYVLIMIVVILILGLFLFGTFANWPMYLGGYSALIESHYSAQLFLIILAVLVLTYVVYRIKRTRFTKYVFIILALLFTSQVALVATLYHRAWVNDVSISFTKAFSIDFGQKTEHQTYSYLNLEGKEYLLDVYQPAPSNRLSIPLIQVHGGGFVASSRTDDRFQQWFTEKGFTVFDVDYPLGTDSVQTWESAANAVATSISFIMENASKFNLDTTQLVLFGGSAGGGLVMQVGYGLGNGNVKSYSNRVPKIPTAIIAVYPPVDMTGMWKFGNDAIDLSSNAKQYIGGPPDQFPERYAKLDIINSVRPGLPATLIITGTYDHVVPIAGIRKLVERLKEVKEPIEFVEVPFGEHYFDGNANSLSGQIRWQVMEKFLEQRSLIKYP